MGFAQQPDIPMPTGGDRSPMLNNNPNLMAMATPATADRSPMLNNNPNLMSMPMSMPIFNRNLRPS
ncbi:MAG: hypothetical protein AB2693_26440, partial [Candidatus Thiodiazotropha sp.]